MHDVMLVKNVMCDRSGRCLLTIAIEGPDRVGKQTQTHMLVEYLRARGITVASVEAPVMSVSTADRIYQMLDDGRAKKYPALFQGLQLANRCQFVAGQLDDLLAENDVLIFDRWNASTHVYGTVAGLDSAALSCYEGIIPDVALTIVLHGPQRSTKADDLDTFERDVEFQRRVKSEYVKWAEGRRDDAIIVNANGSIDEVARRIRLVVKNFIDKNNISIDI